MTVGHTEIPAYNVSVIIPTKFRPDDVELTVKTLLEQTVPPRQVIVIDQSCDGEIRSRIERCYAEAPPLVRQAATLLYIHDTAIPNASAARNRGLDCAGGDVYLFLDDDVRLEKDFLEEILRAYGSHPEAAGISGIFTNYPPPSRAHRIWRAVFFRGPFHDERQPVYWNAGRLTEPVRVRKFTGALMSFRAEAVRHIRFDEDVHGTSAEDLDFCAQLDPEAVLLIAPKARLEHRRSAPGRSRQYWIHTDAERNYYLYRRHWSGKSWPRLCLLWLVVGYGLAAGAASLRRASLAPVKALAAGLREAAAEAGPGRRRHAP